ncbi:hypothetical protein F4779DRAFT_617489 [Xylariaceae sp. FL0662B]|nr:hypothetical protein F4779DRAFT_617489 [Xylariaceae sp. FL0662B]
MAVVLPPMQCPMGSEHYRRNLMIEYAFKTYRYVITAAEVEDILHEGLWEDVDMYVEYMMDANFGTPVPHTNNVKLPRTMRIYSAAELDAMAAGLVVDDDDRPPLRPYADDGVVDALPAAHPGGPGARDVVTIDGDEASSEPESEYEYDEPLPLYDPDMLPRYSTLSYASRPPSTIAPSIDEVELALDELDTTTAAAATTPADSVDLPSDAPSMNEVEIEDGLAETEIDVVGDDTTKPRSLGSRLNRKILKVKQKLARGLERVSLKRTLNRAVENRWKLHLR